MNVEKLESGAMLSKRLKHTGYEQAAYAYSMPRSLQHIETIIFALILLVLRSNFSVTFIIESD